MVKLSGSFLKAAEAKEGDVIEFTNAGEWQTNTKYTYPDGNPRKDFVIKVKHDGQEKSFRLNKTNRSTLVENWGDETDAWVGRKAMVTLMNALVSGQQRKVIVLDVPNGKPKQDEAVAWDD